MVNRDKYHGFFVKLEEYLELGKEDLSELPLIDLRSFLQKNLPEVFEEMSSQRKYAPWIVEGIETVLIYVIKYKKKNVGFVCYDVGNDGTLCLGKVYILEDYRGKGLLGKHLNELNDFRFEDGDVKFLLTVTDPNLYMVRALMKLGFVVPVSSAVVVGLLNFFSMRFGGDGERFIYNVTPFYSMNLGSPVSVIDGELVYSDLSYIDVVDFDMGRVREEFLGDEGNVVALKEVIGFLSGKLDDFVFEDDLEE